MYEHSGLSFDKIAELDILDFRMLLADAVKYRVLNRSDGKGREFPNGGGLGRGRRKSDLTLTTMKRGVFVRETA